MDNLKVVRKRNIRKVRTWQVGTLLSVVFLTLINHQLGNVILYIEAIAACSLALGFEWIIKCLQTDTDEELREWLRK